MHDPTVPTHLRDWFSGALLTPDHPAYDTVGRVGNGAVDRRPAPVPPGGSAGGVRAPAPRPPAPPPPPRGERRRRAHRPPARPRPRPPPLGPRRRSLGARHGVRDG